MTSSSILLLETVNALQMIPGLQLPGQANMVQMPNIMMQNMMPNMQPGMQQMRPGMVQPGQPIFPGQPGYENHNFWPENNNVLECLK